MSFPLLASICWGLTLSGAETAVRTRPSNPFVRVYCAGLEELAAGSDATRFKEIWNLPSTRNAVETLKQKLAHAPNELLALRIDSPLVDRSILVRPLWDDVVGSPWLFEAYGQTEGEPEWTLAIRLNKDRAGIWSANLRELVSVWKLGVPADVTSENGSAWETKQDKTQGQIRWMRAGSWCVFSCGRDAASRQAEMLRQIKANDRPYAEARKEWFEADLNLPELVQALRPWGLLTGVRAPLPQVHLTTSAKDEFLRTNVRLHYAQAMNWTTEAWQIPTNTIRDPLVSFSAAQGFAAWLSRWPSVQLLGIQPMPNQFFSWAMPKSQFVSFEFAAVSTPNAPILLDQIASGLPGFIKATFPAYEVGEITRSTNATELVWRNLPFLAPYLRPVKEKSGNFLKGGLFMDYPSTNPPPTELMAQVTGRTNLLYYHWEITQEQLLQWQSLLQLWHMIAKEPAASNSTAPRKPKPYVGPSPNHMWLLDIAPKLGNAATELTIASPQELTFTRKSHVGLTGFELALLGRYLDEAAFPWFGFQLPARAGQKTPSSTANPGR